MRAVLMRFMLRSLLSKILHAIFTSQKDANGDRPRGLHRLRVLCVLRVRKMPHTENAESAEVKCKMGNTCRAVGVDSGKMPRHQPAIEFPISIGENSDAPLPGWAGFWYNTRNERELE